MYGLFFISADLRLGFIDELYFIEHGLRAIETKFLHSTPTTPTTVVLYIYKKTSAPAECGVQYPLYIKTASIRIQIQLPLVLVLPSHQLVRPRQCILPPPSVHDVTRRSLFLSCPFQKSVHAHRISRGALYTYDNNTFGGIYLSVSGERV